MDTAMSLSEPHPERPYQQTGVKLGDDQFVQSPSWEQKGISPRHFDPLFTSLPFL